MLRLTNIGNLSTYNSATGLFEKITNCNIDIENDLIVNIDKNNRNGIENIIDCKKKLVTPGFVDAHTHPVFKNGREKEFIQRISGKSYEEIFSDGGGINSSIVGTVIICVIEWFSKTESASNGSNLSSKYILILLNSI